MLAHVADTVHRLGGGDPLAEIDEGIDIVEGEEDPEQREEEAQLVVRDLARLYCVATTAARESKILDGEGFDLLKRLATQTQWCASHLEEWSRGTPELLVTELRAARERAEHAWLFVRGCFDR